MSSFNFEVVLPPVVSDWLEDVFGSEEDTNDQNNLISISLEGYDVNGISVHQYGNTVNVHAIEDILDQFSDKYSDNFELNDDEIVTAAVFDGKELNLVIDTKADIRFVNEPVIVYDLREYGDNNGNSSNTRPV